MTFNADYKCFRCRNLSSANKDNEQKGYDTRNKLRESTHLVKCLIYTLKISRENRDRENKIVENCMCALRNLSFRIQEVTEQDFYKKRSVTLKQRQHPDKGNTVLSGLNNFGNKSYFYLHLEYVIYTRTLLLKNCWFDRDYWVLWWRSKEERNNRQERKTWPQSEVGHITLQEVLICSFVWINLLF